jgi:hypothetical protein
MHLTESELREIIRRCLKGDIDPKRPLSDQQVCLYTAHKDPKTGRRRLLGRHADRGEALGQERLIQARKHGR